ncbi:hypothetical protein MX207_005226 [Salmonella enterica]|nr:hypothetical protein [Salmonella enterica]EJC0929237.1 hypothetical protein [Salmonella enterica]
MQVHYEKFGITHSAQCSPRHACPLRGALLMQVHEVAQAAPVLVWRGVENSGFCMQSHAA